MRMWPGSHKGELKDHEQKGIEGVICGRAIYEGKIDLIEANRIFKVD